jgi:cytochrome c biogenesis protein CcmG/thiol:disulfide interchange protein DsbE
VSWLRAALGALVAVPILALLLFGMGRDPRAIDSPLPGRPAPGFELARLEGTPTRGPLLDAAGAALPDSFSLRADSGRIVVLNFFASWCLACRAEHGPLGEAAERYRDSGVSFYGIAYQDRPEDALGWIRRMGGQVYPALVDPGSRTAIEYGLWGVPETFFLGRDGRVAYKHVGPVSRALLAQRLDALLEGEAAGGDAATSSPGWQRGAEAPGATPELGVP